MEDLFVYHHWCSLIPWRPEKCQNQNRWLSVSWRQDHAVKGHESISKQSLSAVRAIKKLEIADIISQVLSIMIMSKIMLPFLWLVVCVPVVCLWLQVLQGLQRCKSLKLNQGSEYQWRRIVSRTHPRNQNNKQMLFHQRCGWRSRTIMDGLMWFKAIDKSFQIHYRKIFGLYSFTCL